MTIYVGTVETIIFLAFIALCVVYNYRKGHNNGIDKLMNHMETIGTLKIVEEDGKKVYLFATFEATNE